MFFALNANAENPIDYFVNIASQKYAQERVNKYYSKALQCNPLESDPSTLKTVIDWMDLEPKLPDWKKLKDIQSVASAANKYASSVKASDKVKHCLAGCYIRQKLDLESAIYIGWVKELSDASDCITDTHFEVGDYYATSAGGVAGGSMECQQFCQSKDVKNLSGEQMLDLALKQNQTN